MPHVPMAVLEEFRKAILAESIPTLARLVWAMRSKGLRYQEIYELANNQAGVSLGEWDDLMGQVDDYESESD